MLTMGFRQPKKARSPQTYLANPLGNTALNARAQRIFAMKSWGLLLLACLLKRFMRALGADYHGAWFLFATCVLHANRTGTAILSQKADVGHCLPGDVLLHCVEEALYETYQLIRHRGVSYSILPMSQPSTGATL